MIPRLLLVEDEPGLVLTLGDRLRAAGYRVEVADTGGKALDRLAAEPFDVLVLDLMLPDIDGFEVCRRLRRRDRSLPVLMLTARGAVADRVRGLETGADDYLVKPFDPAELLARLEALLRRAAAPGHPAPVHRFGQVEVDFRRAECRVGDEPLELSARLFRLLRFFLEHPDEVHSRERLLNEVWGYEALPSTRTVDVHVSWLRRAIEPNPGSPRYLVTVHGMGYRFVPDPE